MSLKFDALNAVRLPFAQPARDLQRRKISRVVGGDTALHPTPKLLALNARLRFIRRAQCFAKSRGKNRPTRIPFAQILLWLRGIGLGER